MPGPRRTRSQVHDSPGHARFEKSNSHEPRRQSPRNSKPSLRVREAMEPLDEDGEAPLQLGKKKRSRVSEIRTMEEPSGGTLSREDKKRRIKGKSSSDSAINYTGKPESKQQEASHTSWTTTPTKPTISSSISKESCKIPSEPRSTEQVQSQTLLADYAIAGVEYVSSTPSSDDEESEEQVVVGTVQECGSSRLENLEAPLSEDLEFDEAEAFQPGEDIRVNDFNNNLTRLQKEGGSSRSWEDIEEEQENLGIQTRDGRFMGFTLKELESRQPAHVPGVRKKRRYERTSYADMANNMEPRMKRLEELTRVTFLSTLDPEICLALVNRVFPECNDCASEAWVLRAARRRVRQNTAQWKSRTIKAMRVWVERVLGKDTAGRELRDHVFNAATLRHMFEAHYSIDNFELVFSFTRYFVDLRKSSPRARWWAQQIFINLAAYTKCVLDVESRRSPATNVEDLRLLSRAGLCKAFNDIGKKEVLRKYRPALDEFFFDENIAGNGKKTADPKKTHDVNDDDLVDVTSLPPGVDKGNVDPHVVIDDRTRSHSDDERGIVFTKKKGQ